MGFCWGIVLGKSLIAILGIGKGSWGHINRLIDSESWDKILLISNEWGQSNFKGQKPVEWLIVNNRARFDVLKDEIKEKLPEGAVCVSLASGNGKEHTAILSALRESRREFELVILTAKGVQYF